MGLQLYIFIPLFFFSSSYGFNVEELPYQDSINFVFETKEILQRVTICIENKNEVKFSISIKNLKSGQLFNLKGKALLNNKDYEETNDDEDGQTFAVGQYLHSYNESCKLELRLDSKYKKRILVGWICNGQSHLELPFIYEGIMKSAK